jgi:hypothetical protein
VRPPNPRGTPADATSATIRALLTSADRRGIDVE